MATRRRRTRGRKHSRGKRAGLGKHALAGKCKIVTVHGRRRKLCWNDCGAIIRNTPASGGSGKGRKRKVKSTKRRRKVGVTPRKRRTSTARRKSSTSVKRSWVVVSRSKAIYKSGPKKGRLKKGCKFAGDKALCEK